MAARGSEDMSQVHFSDEPLPGHRRCADLASCGRERLPYLRSCTQLGLCMPGCTDVCACTRNERKWRIAVLTLHNGNLVVAENVQEGDEVVADLAEVERQLVSLGADHIMCVVCTASCFAPRRYAICSWRQSARRHPTLDS